MIEIQAALHFGKDGNGHTTLRHGWGDPEDGFVWALGPESTLEVTLPRVPGRVFMELGVEPFVRAPDVPVQRLDIVANGVTLARRRLACPATLLVEIPPNLVRQREILFRLRHPDAASPAKLGGSTDRRELSLQLHTLTLLRTGPRDEPPQPAGPGVIAAEYRFGGNETTSDMLLEGWAPPEIDYVWAMGQRSTLRLPIAQPEAAHMLLLDVKPFTVGQLVPRQRVAIGVDDHLLEFVSLQQRTCLAYALPAPQPGRQDITISFDHFDAGTPRPPGACLDDRPLSFMLCGVRVIRRADPPGAASAPLLPALAGQIDNGSLQQSVQQATGHDAAYIASGFENLGNACEFGLLQRKLGQDPTGLLRFSGIMTPYLVEGILNGFRFLGRPDRMTVDIRDEFGSAYWVLNQAYALGFQTSISSHGMDRARMLRHMAAAMPFLARKFFEDAVQAEKIFVLQRRDPVARAEADAVLAALSIWGDVTLLWVLHDDALAGQTERLGPRLLRGFVTEDFTPGGAVDDAWLSMLANAWRLAKL
jgi:hypothetical protein